ncbi:SDR family NAD(P)-dependent oxidoreductase [Roseateles chitinivorans]|uniref:SDR family NAD(P)-dependent oxidoreductase n=1 Tax=Roseateles chitinivorans TaxID=2917965 RepID=UPI003D66FAA5
MDLRLKGRKALVTGSSKGIGEAIARRLAREGVIVIVHGRDRLLAAKVVDEVVGGGGRAHAVVGDLTRDEDVQRLVDDAEQFAGAMDIVINNAGGSGGSNESWEQSRPESWMAAYDRNVLSAVRVTKRLLPGMREARWGRVINLSSLAATMSPAARADYSASKAAINALTASMAKAVAGDGVTVNAVSPGTIHSAALDTAFRQAAAERGLAEPEAPWPDVERVALPIFAQVPVGRVGRLEEIADTIAFLASPLAGYITGINLRVDGGMSPSL